MAHIVTDRVLETTTTTGTGNITLAGAVSQFQDFDSQMANADTTAYFIKGISGSALTEWEVGLGTWNTGNTLTRTTVVRSSNSNAAVNFSAGTKLIGMTFTPTVRQPGMTFTGALSPATNDLAALGSGTLSWADLFLATGGVINWNNGGAQITGTATALTYAASAAHNFTGGSLTLPQGTATVASLFFPDGGAVLTTADAGAIERDATNFYATTDDGNRGYVSVKHFTRLAANRNLTNDTAENPLFAAAQDTITLEAGVYRFESLLRVTNMSATSGNALIDWLGAGTAVVDTWAWWYEAIDNSNPSPGPLAPTSIGWPFQQDSAASIAVAAINTALAVVARGTFDITTGGTMIPSIDLVTANAAILSAGSYWMCERMGATDVLTVGQWG